MVEKHTDNGVDISKLKKERKKKKMEVKTGDNSQ